MSTPNPAKAAAVPFTPYQKLVVGILAFLQFTIILDFMILSPLGAILMPELHITPAQFALVVSVYAFSAGTSGLLAAGFADRFDRKKMLLFFYTGFLLGTFFCAMAPSYPFLLAARMVTGVFGGVIGSIVFAITTDLFPFEVRGRVMGVIQTAFAASQVLGIPLGLYFSNLWGWHAPFLMIVIVGVAAGLVILRSMKPIDAHLKLRTDRNPFHHLFETLTTPRYALAFAGTALLATGGFMLMPFSSAFTTNNLGVSLHQLPMVYMVTGICSIIAGPIVGRMSDSIGKFKVFCAGSVISVLMVLVYTHLGVTPLSIVILVSVVMFVGVSSRMISAQALLSGVPAPASRGSFMAVNSAIQQISGGIASLLAGMIVAEGDGGRLEHFDVLGYVVCGALFFTMAVMYFVNGSVARALKAGGSQQGRPASA